VFLFLLVSLGRDLVLSGSKQHLLRNFFVTRITNVKMAKQSSFKVDVKKFLELSEFVSELGKTLIFLKEEFHSLIANIKSLAKHLDQELSTVKSDCNNLNGKITDQKCDTEMLKNKLVSLKSEFDRCNNKIIGCELQLCKQEESMIKQNLIKIKQNTAADRKRNIIIKGLQINSRNDRCGLICKFFKEAMQIEVQVTKVIQIPLLSKGLFLPAFLVVLKSQEEKRKIFGNCHKLKYYPSKISICDDLCKEEREERKHVIQKFINAKKLVKKSTFHVSTVGVTKEEIFAKAIPRKVQLKQVTTKGIASQEVTFKEMPGAVQLKLVKRIDNSTRQKEPDTDNFFSIPESNKILLDYKRRIIQRKGQKEYLGLLARVAAFKRTRQKNCTCKIKDEYDRYKDYAESKLMGRQDVGWLFNVLKDARLECKRLWFNVHPNVDDCYCLQTSLEEKLLLITI